jgi:hypothetical protein
MNKVTRMVVAMAGFALACVNTNAGRWLSRDPIQEGAGFVERDTMPSAFQNEPNPYAFVANEPLSRYDAFGLRMSLRVETSILDEPPIKGPGTGAFGLTMFSPFAPSANVFKSISESCCWKINFSGHATIFWWYLRNVEVARIHELQHVDYHRTTFDNYNNAAEAFTGICFSQAKANCYSSVIVGIMKEAYLASNALLNSSYDCSSNGDRCGDVLYWSFMADHNFYLLNEELAKCSALK